MATTQHASALDGGTGDHCKRASSRSTRTCQCATESVEVDDSDHLQGDVILDRSSETSSSTKMSVQASRRVPGSASDHLHGDVNFDCGGAGGNS